ncbi:non-ribosomal peptide synthetase [Pseudomonas cremoricolorata]|uniref:non-ribosomal peptide synthetase n=1 Tax=Pseudomonas cremoricolorata TaxID=157783 RepID=UPI000402469C|nr:non-ribosomal peptide synthetase [Pseudomonas cremoricolorata]
MSDIDLQHLGAGLPLLAEQQHWSDPAHGAAGLHLLRIDIAGELHQPALQAALNDLALRQQVLTSAIAAVPGYHGQRQFPAARAAQVPLSVEDGASAEDLAAWLAHAAQGGRIAALLQRLDDRWQLTLALPRALVDAGSLGVLAEQLYEAYRQGPAGADDELGQFEQYLQWRAEVVLDEDAGQAAQYWQAHLGNPAVAVPHLPYRRSGAGAAETGVAEVQTRVGDELREAIEALAGAQGVSADSVLQAAWWLLLARISGRSALIAGWRHDGRSDYAFFEQTLGLFEKTLPLHLPLDLQRPFDQCLAQLAAVLDAHRTWQEYCPDSIRATPPSHSFAVRCLPGSDQAGLARWTVQVPASLEPGIELALQVGLDGSGAVQALQLTYLSQHYSAAAMAGLLAQYQVLLRGIVAAPATAAGDLPLLGDAERSRLLALNPPSAALDPRLNLAERIRDWAESTPDAAALVSAAQTLSYAELEQQVQHLAAHMAAQGVVRGQRVALALPRSAHWLVAALASWRLGAAWLALDPQWPAARLALLLEQAGAALLVSEQPLELEIAQLHLAGLDLSHAPAALPEQPALIASDLAYALFTSGSTGTPKAVAVEHGALFNYVAAASAALDLASCRHFAFSASTVADLGHTSLFGALYHGATLHLADDATLQDANAFAGFIREQAIDCLKIVPSHLAALLDTQAPALPATLVLGGEALPPALAERLLHLRPEMRLFNHYGPSESTVGVAVHHVTLDDLDAAALPLSQVLANNQLLVLDAQRRLVASGELGELYIGGAQLARGYLNAPDAQAQAFIEHPWLPGQRLYRSGDLARYRPEGGIVLYGRADQQVKLRGFRVELAEIEAQLAGLAGVSEAAVVLDAQHEPLALVTALGAAPADLGESLKAQLQQRLPAVMVPRQVHVLAQMPRLGNGKIDRKALASLDLSAAQQPYVAPRDALENILAGRMAQLLGSERLSVEQDFFAAGGHSLLVIKLVAGIRKLLHCDVHPGVVFDNPSPAALAQALRLQESAPGQLEKLATARLRLEAMSPEEKARLLEKAQPLG